MSVRFNPIARFAVERRVTMGMVVAGIVVLGWLSLERLPLEFMPSFAADSIWVRAPYNSSSPEEVERRIVRPLEDMMGTINGIDNLSSSASANQGSVNISFVPGTDMDLAAMEVRDRIDRVRHLLPTDLERVFIRRFQSSDIPVLEFHLSADWSKDRLFDFMENVIRRRLERIEGVAQVETRGLETRQLQVNINPAQMRAHGIDVREVAAALRAGNLNVSGGYIKESSRKLLVRSLGEFETVSEVGELPLDGSGLKLKDVATVQFTFPRKEQFNFLNGREALTVNVNKASTANLLAVVDGVKAELEEIQKMSGAQALEVRIFRDASVDVREGLSQLARSGMIGGALAVLFLFVFLRRFRTTLLVAIAIPLAVVLTFILMYFARQSGASPITLNIMSLMGLMLAVGMLVDNSIVVIESIFRHRQELGEDARTAALAGTTEVAMPILASTATTVCVFVPMVFLGSGGGFMRFLSDVGTTIMIVMVASLLVALTIVPMLAAVLLRGESTERSAAVDALVRAYGRGVGFTLRHRFAFMMAVVGMLYGSWLLFGTIERTFTPRSMERQVAIRVDTPRQYSVEETDALYREIVTVLEAKREDLEIADIAYSYNRGSSRSGGGFRGGKRIEIYLLDEAKSRRSTREIREAIREFLPVKPGVTLTIAQGYGHGGSTGIQMDLMGDDLKVLELLADKVGERLRAIPWVRDVDTSVASGDQEIHVQVNRERALAAGLSSQAVAFTINNALSTRPVSHFKTDQREIDIVMQFREQDRENLDQLRNLPVAAGAALLPVATFADFSFQAGPRSIDKEDRRPKVTISANTTAAGTSERMMGQVSEIMSGLSLPPGYSWGFGRWSMHGRQDMANAAFSLILALALIYMIMAALFEDFVQPFTIMLSIPFAFIGVGAILRLTSQSLDNMTNLGLLILVGVVVNNAIVLIDHINRLRREGLSREEAIVLGGKHRLRPILMTTLTTLLGLAPMVAPLVAPGWFGTVDGRAATWAPVGLVIVGGLTTSTLLTLVIVPTIYSLVDDFKLFLGRVVAKA
jgi:HAE1 family hydrophobic/amphiphilic exporter-1